MNEVVMHTVKNKLDLDFKYSSELSRDLLEIHNIAIENFIPKIHGTYFTIKFVHRDMPLVFKLQTNDKRDPVFYFGERTFPVFRLELYGEHQGENAIIELFKQTIITEEDTNDTTGI